MDSNSDLDEFQDDDEEPQPNSLFQQAADFVQAQTTKPGAKQLEQKKLLELYGFYKVATVGRCNDPKPGLFDMKGKAKWSAWVQVSTLSTEAAEKGYIKCVKKYLDWTPEAAESSSSTKNSKSKSKSSCGGNSVSTMAKPSEDDQDGIEEANTIFSWAKDNSLKAIQTWLKAGNSPNVQDGEGMSPLHWAVDRGHYDACILLLNAGADLRAKDNDGQTAMDYAISCEHQQIVLLLEDRQNYSHT